MKQASRIITCSIPVNCSALRWRLNRHGARAKALEFFHLGRIFQYFTLLSGGAGATGCVRPSGLCAANGCTILFMWFSDSGP